MAYALRCLTEAVVGAIAIAILGGLAALSDIVFRRRFRDFPW